MCALNMAEYNKMESQTGGYGILMIYFDNYMIVMPHGLIVSDRCYDHDGF